MEPKKDNRYEIDVYRTVGRKKDMVLLDDVDLLFKKAGVDFSINDEDGNKCDNSYLFIYFDEFRGFAADNGLDVHKGSVRRLIDLWSENEQQKVDLWSKK